MGGVDELMPLLDLYSLWSGAASGGSTGPALTAPDIRILYQADILVNGVAASTEFSRIKLTLQQLLKDMTQAGDVARCYKHELYSIHADGEFYYQAGAHLISAELEAATAGPASPGPMVLSLSHNLAIGDLVNIWKGVNAQLGVGAQHGEIVRGEVSTEGAYRCVQALRLLRDQQTSSSGLGQAVRLGAVSSSQSLFAALHVVGTTSTPAGTALSIISSPSSSLSSPTTRLTFTAGTSGYAGEWAEAAGAVTDPWFAAQWSGFPGTAFTASISAGIE